MREILFRGKHPNGEWVEGSLIAVKDFTAILECESDRYEYPYLDNDLGTIDGYAIPVIPETVGQYTGLTDKNGKKIFEGDIVDMGDNWWDAFGPAGHDSQKTIVHWSEEHCGFDPFANYDCDCGVYIQAKRCTVIGNIHDNPELLEGGAPDGV